MAAGSHTLLDPAAASQVVSRAEEPRSLPSAAGGTVAAGLTERVICDQTVRLDADGHGRLAAPGRDALSRPQIASSRRRAAKSTGKCGTSVSDCGRSHCRICSPAPFPFTQFGALLENGEA